MSASRPPGCAGSRPSNGRPTARLLDLDRYVPAFVTFIANKLSNSATAVYQRNFGINVTEWRIMTQLALEPGIPASRICQRHRLQQGADQPHAGASCRSAAW